MQVQHPDAQRGMALSAQERRVLLEEVDFKWLMAGEGWWVDTGRLHQEPAYARGLLALAASAGSVALRLRATRLQADLQQVFSCQPGLAPH